MSNSTGVSYLTGELANQKAGDSEGDQLSPVKVRKRSRTLMRKGEARTRWEETTTAWV